jgi:hypothetical protein
VLAVAAAAAAGAAAVDWRCAVQLLHGAGG